MAENETLSASLARGAHALVDRLILFGTATKPALVIGAAIFAYLNQPVIRFIDAYPAYEGAAIAGLGLVLMTAGMTVRRDFVSIVAGFAGFVMGTIWFGDAIDGAVARAARNDNRCYRIETEMLSDKPPRADLPELYQALGCRPMSELYMMPKTTGR